MKKFYLAGLAAMLLLASCGESSSADSDALDAPITDSEDVHEAAVSFREGGAYDGQSYFSGLLAEVIEADVKFREIQKLDEIDASEEEITNVLDSAKHQMGEARKALDLYANKDWPKRGEFHTLTLEWFDVVEGIMDDYLYELAEPMSRPDDTWSQEELDFYDEYVLAYDDYIDVDGRWVDFQYVYAAANGFEIGELIDEEAMVEEQVSADHHEE